MAVVNMPPVPALPERPKSPAVHEAIHRATSQDASGTTDRYILAAEVQHLWKVCEDDGWSWGSLYAQVQCVNDVAGEDVQEWLRSQGRGKLADELEELSYRADGDSLAERRLAAMGDVVAAARVHLLATDSEDAEPEWRALDQALGRLDSVGEGR